ncbi:MAG: carboxypeptidase regulatory-like domain-containing protein [Candidatus Wallbacteria bacterium]|nr:carboxypeptidase regulatory-like domain-containing protein [Candidatus Wallbacteria bacterium]
MRGLEGRVAAHLFLGVLTAALTGCGGEPAKLEVPKRTATPIDAATVATITGEVSLKGTPPSPKKMKMSGSECTAHHKEPPMDESVIVKDGKLQNVFVHVKSGLEKHVFAVPETPKVIDQKGCIFAPHVIGVQVHQPLELRNSDSTLHNFHSLPRNSTGWNIGFPMSGVKELRSVEKAEVMIEFKCDIHGWMKGFIGAVDHPFFAVTGPDGKYELKGLPPGDYEVEAWHETFGTSSQKVKLAAKQTHQLPFVFDSGK